MTTLPGYTRSASYVSGELLRLADQAEAADPATRPVSTRRSLANARVAAPLGDVRRVLGLSAAPEHKDKCSPAPV